MSVPEARRDPALRRYPLRRLRLPMAGGNLSLVVPDANAWLRTAVGGRRAVQAAELGHEPPYWASVWPAAVAVARWLSRCGDLTDRSVLDLGCGLGVPGAAAARAGAAVTFADCEPDALRFARFNACAQLVDAGAAGAQRVRTEQLDWRRDTLSDTFDVVCLSDVTYRPCHHLPVLRHLDGCLRRDGLAVHAEPFRRESSGFLQLAEQRFATCQQEVATWFDERRVPVRVTFLAGSRSDLRRWLGAATDVARGAAQRTLPGAGAP